MLTILSGSQNYYLRGGSDRVFLETMALLSEHGHQVIPFAGQDPRNEPSQWSRYFPVTADFDNPGPVDLLRYVYSRPAAQQIRRLIDQSHPDIAHLHIYYGKLTASILDPLVKAGIPIVQSLHEYKLICPVYTLVSDEQICEACRGRNFWQALPRRCNRGSFSRTLLSVTEMYASRWQGSVNKIDLFIAVSDFVRRKMIEHAVPAEKIITIHNFIDWHSVEASYGPGDYLLYFGRLEKVKGIFTLLEAIAPLTNVPLYIVGAGEALEEIENVVTRRQLHHVKLLGFQSGQVLDSLIKGSICTVVPSEWYEPLPLTIIESFARGRAVIASNIGGIPEMVSNGVDGFLIPPADPLALRDRIAWMAQNRSQAAEMGREGRQTVEQKFGPELYYERLMDAYRQVL